MELKTIYELKPTRTQKSFYGKANVGVTEDEFGTTVHLFSYNTLVLSYRLFDEVFCRHWDDYSRTTARHISSFVEHFAPSSGTDWLQKGKFMQTELGQWFSVGTQIQYTTELFDYKSFFE